MYAAATEISVKVDSNSDVGVVVKLNDGGKIKVQIRSKNRKRGRKLSKIWQRLGKIANVATLILFLKSDLVSEILKALLAALPFLAR
jgi:hypothetical protein